MADTGVTWKHTTYGPSGIEHVHQTSLSCGCNVDYCGQRCVFHGGSVVTPSRTDRQPPTSATQAKGGQDSPHA